MRCNLPAFVEQTPEYEVRDGWMHITIGDLALAMRLDVFLDGCELGKAAIVDWHRRQCGLDQKVVPFARP